MKISALDFPPNPQRCCALNVFFWNLILRFCFRAIINENKKAVIVERRLVSNHIPLRPKHWFAINARDFVPVVGHLRFGGFAFVRINDATTKTTTTTSNEQEMPNMKRALANPLHASDMLSFRILHCGSDVSMQKPPKVCKGVVGAWTRAASLLWNGFLSRFCFKGGGLVCWIGAHEHCLRRRPMSDPVCPQSAVSENNHVPSKISGHENGWLVVTPKMCFFSRENQQKISGHA